MNSGNDTDTGTGPKARDSDNKPPATTTLEPAGTASNYSSDSPVGSLSPTQSPTPPSFTSNNNTSREAATSGTTSRTEAESAATTTSTGPGRGRGAQGVQDFDGGGGEPLPPAPGSGRPPGVGVGRGRGAGVAGTRGIGSAATSTQSESLRRPGPPSATPTTPDASATSVPASSPLPDTHTEDAAESNKEAKYVGNGGKEAAVSMPPAFLAPILDGLDSLSLLDEDDDLDVAKAIAIKVKETCDSVNKLTSVLDSLHERSLSSPILASKTAFVFGCLSQLEVQGVKCRNVFLRRIQSDFTAVAAKERLNDRDRNLTVLLCQVFRRVRVAGGSTIRALIAPILQSLTRLLSGDGEPTDHGAAVFCEQVQILGPEMRAAFPDEFEDLMTNLRFCLASTTAAAKALSSPGLLRLMLVMELNASLQWTLSDRVRMFYMDNLPINSLFTPMEVSKQPSTIGAGNNASQSATATAPPKSLTKTASLPPPQPRQKNLPRVIPAGALTLDTSRPPPNHHHRQAMQRSAPVQPCAEPASLFQSMPPVTSSAHSPRPATNTFGANREARDKEWGGGTQRQQSSEGWGSSREGGAGGGVWGECNISPRSQGTGGGGWSQTGEDRRGSSFSSTPSSAVGREGNFSIGTWE